jgi:hypothetical protein
MGSARIIAPIALFINHRLLLALNTSLRAEAHGETRVQFTCLAQNTFKEDLEMIIGFT